VGTLIEGKVIVVTGAGSGIGAATSILAAAEGALGVVLSDTNGQGLEATAEEIRAQGCQVEIAVGDLTEDRVPDDLVRRAVERFGRLDLAANCAGIDGQRVPIEEVSDEMFDQVLGVNLRALFRCMRAQLIQMYTQGEGAIVNIASAVVLGVRADMAAYVASKAGVVGLTKVASKEAGPKGVRVNAVSPGWINTPVGMRSPRAQDPNQLKAIPLPAPAEPKVMGESILWLLSDKASFTTGAVLVADGGRTG
jgi:NAD(P)-dependent dehydrogenase (short-subunit alcohol dehydrogenase family)